MKTINFEVLENIKKVRIPSFNESLILSIVPPENGSYITSHQPTIYTPGIISKFLYKKRDKVIVYNDSDRAEFKFLSKSLNLNKPIERLDHDDINKIKEFVYDCSRSYEELIEDPETKQNIQLFLSILQTQKTDKFPLFWNNLMIKFFEKYGINIRFEVRLLSELSKEIKDFFYWVIDNYSDFKELYNEAIRIFRESVGFYPIKELENNELPFWLIQGNERKTMYLDKELDLDLSQVRPKAVAWAIFRRYFLYKDRTDILGVGSSYYNFVADHIAANLLSQSPPPTTVVTLSIPLKIDTQKIIRAKSIINSFKTSIFVNPEKLRKILNSLTEYQKFLTLDDIQTMISKIEYDIDKDLLRKKNQILNEINKKENRGIKKELTRQINQINQMIVEQIKEKLEDLYKLTEILEIQVERLFEEYKSLSSRDYPYFYINPNEIFRILDVQA